MNRDDLNWRQAIAERKALRTAAAHKLRPMVTRRPAQGHKRRMLAGLAWLLVLAVGVAVVYGIATVPAGWWLP